MAVAVYTTDLADIALGESGTYIELTGWLAGTPSTGYETDYFIQGTACKSSTAKTTQSSLGIDYGSGITIPTDGAVLVWQVMFAPNSLDSYVNGGMRVAIGNSSSAFYEFFTGGVDRAPNPYGGWINSAVNPNVVAARDATTGTPTGTWQVFGTLIRTPVTAPSKGAPVGLDAIRYGRCELRVVAGDSGAPANFTDMAVKNDMNEASNYNRWGLFSYQGGSFVNKGLVTFGYGGLAYFVDSNKVVNIEDTPKVTENFNTWSIENVSTVHYMSNCVLQSLGATSPGRVVMVNVADVQWTSCLFKDWGTFTFLFSAVLSSTTFLRCKAVTSGGASFVGAKILIPNVIADASAFIWNSSSNPNAYTQGMTFSKGTTAHHAIQFDTSSPITINLTGITFSGFNATNAQNDSTLYFADKGSDTTWTVNLSGCSGNISYKKARATDTVNLVYDQVNFTFTVNPSITGYEWRIYSVTALGSLAGATELDGEETASTDNQTYTYSYAGAVFVAVQIISQPGLDYEESITYYTLGDIDQNVTINLTPDTNN